MTQSRGYRIFSFFNTLFFIILAVVMLFPIYKVIITSFITVGEHYSSPLTLWPKAPTLDSYRFIFASNEILNALQVTVFVTIVGTFLSMFFTLLLAYALSKSFLVGGEVYPPLPAHHHVFGFRVNSLLPYGKVPGFDQQHHGEYFPGPHIPLELSGDPLVF
jgi:hypothetical protein